MPANAVEARRVRIGFRTIVSLTLCAAAAGAALAHFAIDVLGDYALSRDSYDNLGHGSRDLVTALALVFAAFLAARGLRVCCEIAARNRARLVRPAMRPSDVLAMFGGAIAVSAATVPAMEYLDGRLDGVPVRGLAEAFGGSIALGLGTTILCTALLAAVVYAIARWLISHRDSIATIIETLLRPFEGAASSHGYDRVGRCCTPRRRRAPTALRLSKRGPPATSFA